ncbi:MAG: HEAT repeat domain-containing protein [Proteobacteria bacterium]|nr:HEAT repeat domain-containing protein [Pseudomonadota bacterium]
MAALLESWFGAPAPRTALVGAMTMVIGLGVGYLLFATPSNEGEFPAQTALLAPGMEGGGSQITAVRFVDADASDGEVELAFQAVKPMRLKGSPDDPAIQRLLAYALDTEPNAGIRIRTVNTLTENPQPQIDPEIRTALVQVVKYDTNPGVRKQAMQALRNLPMDPDIKNALLYVLANDPNEGLRIDAIDTLLPERVEQTPDDHHILQVLRSRMQNENNSYIRLRTKAALQEVQP